MAPSKYTGREGVAADVARLAAKLERRAETLRCRVGRIDGLEQVLEWERAALCQNRCYAQHDN
jgi:hypothetical protein